MIVAFSIIILIIVIKAFKSKILFEKIDPIFSFVLGILFGLGAIMIGLFNNHNIDYDNNLPLLF